MEEYPDPTMKLEMCSYKIFVAFQKCLDSKKQWKLFVESLESFGNKLSPSETDQLYLEANKLGGSPAKYLWMKLQSWLITVEDLIALLRHCHLLEPLNLLVQPEPLQITVQPGEDEEDKLVNFGSKLVLQCEARGLPPPQYQWYHENDQIGGENESQLLLESLSADDSGVYFCVVSHTPNGGSEKHIHSNYINVIVKPPPPKVTNQSNELNAVHKGDSLLIRIFSDPPPEQLVVNWYLNGRPLEDEHDSLLFLEHISNKEEGYYVCELSNESGKCFSKAMHVIVVPRYSDTEDSERDDGQQTTTASCKVALLIANDRYDHLQNLETPANDIHEIGKILGSLDFVVFSVCNLKKSEMEQYIEEFCHMVPPKAHIFFYYVGHGFLMFDKYFMPVDCSEDNFLRSDCVCDKQIMATLLKTDPQLVVFVLDMCLVRPDRDINPTIYLEDITFHEDYRLNSNCSIFEAFATTSQSYERPSQTLGIYAQHLVKFLPKAHLSVSQVFLEAHADLIKFNEGTNQRPLICVDAASLFKLSDNFIPGVHKKVLELFSLYTTVKRSDFTMEFEKINLKLPLYVSDYQSFLNRLTLNIGSSQLYQLRCSVNSENLLVEWVSGEAGHPSLIIHHLQKMRDKLELKISLFDEKCAEPVDECDICLGRPLIMRALSQPYKQSKWKNYLNRIRNLTNS